MPSPPDDQLVRLRQHGVHDRCGPCRHQTVVVCSAPALGFGRGIDERTALEERARLAVQELARSSGLPVAASRRC